MDCLSKFFMSAARSLTYFFFIFFLQSTWNPVKQRILCWSLSMSSRLKNESQEKMCRLVVYPGYLDVETEANTFRFHFNFIWNRVFYCESRLKNQKIFKGPKLVNKRQRHPPKFRKARKIILFVLKNLTFPTWNLFMVLIR